MNLTEVFNVALPELPARRVGQERPRLHAKAIAGEQIEGGIPTVVAMVSGGTSLFRFTPMQWKAVELFDGTRSYQEISDLYAQQSGITYSEDQLREFAEDLVEGGLFQRTGLEFNITASEKLADQRRRRTKKKKLDLAAITVASWDPDAYLDRLHEAVGFIYTGWFTFLTLAVFALMTLIFIGGWSEIWRDTFEYYTFTDKRFADIAEFWVLFASLGFFHESAHGLTCKHFGGGVHRMGFMLIFLSPAFFCDITEVCVYGGKWPRAAAIIAGIWVELMFCAVASVLWWGTPAGTSVHDFAYKVMLITGIAVPLMNLNPLIKLDGYYLMSELVGVPSIKERSTEYVSSWVKHNCFGLPVEIPYVPRRRRWLFASYAIASSLYSYIVLFAAVIFTYNVCSRFSPQWAFIPALMVALLILRSRLRSSLRFMKDFYLDKRQAFQQWWTVRRRVAAGASVLVALFAPVWHETVSGRFVLEPNQRALIRATVPGQITEVLTDEGWPITAGAPVLRLRNVYLEEEEGRASADLRLADASTRQALLNYSDLAHGRSEHASQLERYQSISERLAGLQVVSPISGVVVTPRIRNSVGSFVAEGSELAEVDDVQTLKARIFVPNFEICKVAPHAAVSLKLESLFELIRGQVNAIAPATSALPPGLQHQEQYKGIVAPDYYVATVIVPKSGRDLRPGMSGQARIEVARRSFAGFVGKNVREFIQRKVW